MMLGICCDAEVVPRLSPRRDAVAGVPREGCDKRFSFYKNSICIIISNKLLLFSTLLVQQR